MKALKRITRARWKNRGRHKEEGRDDLRKVQIKPDPILKEITFDVAEAGLTLLGVDIEAMIAGRTCKPVPPIQTEKGRRFLDTVLVNAHKYDLGSMPFDRASGLITTVAAAFFFECCKQGGMLNVGAAGK